jgi:hypothetical protein
MIVQLSKACSSIADVLPRTELSLILYPTNNMKEAVAMLYVRILKFIQHAMYWYKQSKIVHAWNAVTNPWALSIKNYVDDIGDQSRNVDNLASSAFKAELRDTRNEVCETRKELNRVQNHINQLLQIAQSKSK